MLSSVATRNSATDRTIRVFWDSRSALMCRARSAVSTASLGADLWPSRRSWSTWAGLSRLTAVSAQASTEAKNQRDERTDGQPHVRTRHRRGPARLELGDERTLEAEHLRLILGLGMVVTQQVQDSVRQQDAQLMLGAVACRLRLLQQPPAGHSTTSPSTPVHRRPTGLAGPQLVHRERHHVRRPGLVEPLVVQNGDLVGFHDRRSTVPPRDACPSGP